MAELDGAGGSAVAQVAGHDAQLLDGTAQHLSGALRDILVRGAVEAVAAHLILGVPTVRNGIDECLGGHGLMESGVENSDHGLAGHNVLACLDTNQVCRVVQRSQGDALLDALHNLTVDDDRVGKLLTAVNHAVTHCVDLVRALDDAVMVVLQDIQHLLDGDLVIGQIHVSVEEVLTGGSVL